MRMPPDGGRLDDAGSDGGPVLGAGPTSVRHGCDGRRRVERWKTDSSAPLPGAPKCRITGSGRPLRFELWGARGDRALYLSVSQGSKLLNELHKRHRVYISSGHHCGVIPYSSLWWVDCLLG